MEPFVYLASQSPRRRQLLEQIGVRYTLLLANSEDNEPEDPEALEAVLPRESATDYVQRVTENLQVYRYRLAGTPVQIQLERDLHRGQN